MIAIDAVNDAWLIDLATKYKLTWRLWAKDVDGLTKVIQEIELKGSDFAPMLQLAKLKAIGAVMEDPVLGLILKRELLAGEDIDELVTWFKKWSKLDNLVAMAKVQSSMLQGLATEFYGVSKSR